MLDKPRKQPNQIHVGAITMPCLVQLSIPRWLVLLVAVVAISSRVTAQEPELLFRVTFKGGNH
jgi:hypothetical protein